MYKGGNLFSFFAKKKEKVQPGVLKATPLPVNKQTGADVVPENFPKASPLAGKKRITQRLPVQAVKAFQNAGARQFPIANEQPVVELGTSSEPEMTVDVPAKVIINALPESVLAASRDVILPQVAPGQVVKLPLMTVLPMLPSGRVEFGVQEIAALLPGHFLQPAESISGVTFIIPLFEIASRIPQEALMLRVDQQPIDSMALKMEDPFNPEQLRIEAEKAERESVVSAQAEPVDDVPEVPAKDDAPVMAEEAPPLAIKVEQPAEEPKPEPEIPVAEIPLGGNAGSQLDSVSVQDEDEAVDISAKEELPVPSQEIEPEPEPEPVKPLPKPDANVEPDFSFAQTEQFKRFLAQLEDEIAAKNQAVAQPEPELPKDSNITEMPADILVEEKEAPAPLPPDALTFAGKVEDDVTAQSETLGPVPAANDEPPPLAQPLEFKKTLTQSFNLPHTVNLSPRVNDILGLPQDGDLTLKEVAAHIRRWPGVQGCAIVDKGGMPIAFDMNDTEFAKNLSAFAPKILSRVHELFSDIGLLGAPEIQVPSADFSTYICRHGEVYFVLLHDDVNMPVWYSLIIKQILAELSFAPREA